MIETLDYIDNYFNGRLTPAEKVRFEEKCETDRAFAEEVAFYVSARTQIRNDAVAEKKKEFADLYTQLSSQKPPRSILRRIFPYVAAVAACFILFIGWQLFFREGFFKENPSRLASEFINTNLDRLSVTMGGAEDSLSLGINAFNRKDYNAAERIFKSLSHANNNGEVIKNLGLVYLVTQDYTNALSNFDALSRRTDLYANPGLFYKAVTLMKRSESGDADQAKLILKEIIQKELPGSKEAKEWLKKM